MLAIASVLYEGADADSARGRRAVVHEQNQLCFHSFRGAVTSAQSAPCRIHLALISDESPNRLNGAVIFC